MRKFQDVQEEHVKQLAMSKECYDIELAETKKQVFVSRGIIIIINNNTIIIIIIIIVFNLFPFNIARGKGERAHGRD